MDCDNHQKHSLQRCDKLLDGDPRCALVSGLSEILVGRRQSRIRQPTSGGPVYRSSRCPRTAEFLSLQQEVKLLKSIRQKEMATPIEVFFSYSHTDEKLLNKLRAHLANLEQQKIISGWHDRRIVAGNAWGGEIDEHLNSAKIILLLISSDFMQSKYCRDIEVTRAVQRHKAKEARVIPVILRDVDWDGAPFSHLQALPDNAKAVTLWRNRDQAFKNIAEGVKKVANMMKLKSESPEELPPDYYFLNHSSFLRVHKQAEFRKRTGVPFAHYDIRVIVDSYYEGALEKVEKVTYILDEAYPEQIRTITNSESSNKFLLKELANGEYVLMADIYVKGRKEPIHLQRHITLWKSGPKLP